MRDRLFQEGIKAYKWIARHHTMLPRSIEVETTKACNLRCPGCRRNYKEGSIYSEPGPQHLTVEALEKMVVTTNCSLIRFEGDGEPMMNPHLKEILEFLNKMDIRSMMTSNGTLINEDWIKVLEDNGMRRIHISFDGATRDTYESIKVGADFDKVLHNCKLVGNSRIQLYMNVVLFNDDVVEQLPMYVDQAKSVGATGIHYMKMQQDSLEFGQPPKLSEHKDTISKFNELTRKAGLRIAGTCSDDPKFVPCYDPFINPYVLLNNDVYACTYMANLRRSEVYHGKVFDVPYQNYKMGNLDNNSMKEIWYNDSYKELRRRLREAVPRIKSLTKDELVFLKEEMEDYDRFSFCYGCLCQWGESGL